MPPTRKAAAAARRSMSRTKEDEKPKGLAARRSRPAGAKPTMVDMIAEAIEKAGDAHDGASRPLIKKFIISKFKLEDNATTDGRIATAIRRGNESGVFALPKGFGGKIRIAEDGDKPYVKPKAGSKGTKRTSTGTKKTATSSSSTARKPPAKRTTANSTGTARQKQSEGGKRGAAKTNAKRGATTSTMTSSRSTPAKKTASKSSPRKTTSSSSRRARN
ncbi:RHTO0S04e02014g1_1 [Rhodotorula toruloides]|uniref:Histone H1 n=2 Tax=Rhodotorula toruloides TaxID=5286 RepID=A0A061AWP5_RHOTO|nr:Histone H1/H5 [Rhodotorula toruloides NP11]EMS20633.1 Histone H1/H5 [Rhodotorula toruloides NP11]CDR39133.1 RHTO0S04e02014g1_1 [Rhodotorula toruloides]